MIIDFKEYEQEIIPNFLGGELEVKRKIMSDDNGRIMYITIPSGASIGMHRHETNSETVYILSGTATVTEESSVTEIGAGVCHYCPKGSAHSIKNNGTEDLCMFAVVANQ